jgi:hypothetical protein
MIIANNKKPPEEAVDSAKCLDFGQQGELWF